jgi:hypothetical protein
VPPRVGNKVVEKISGLGKGIFQDCDFTTGDSCMGKMKGGTHTFQVSQIPRVLICINGLQCFLFRTWRGNDIIGMIVLVTVNTRHILTSLLSTNWSYPSLNYIY